MLRFVMGNGRLAGKRVLLTGAASGIGRASAVRIAEDGADVALIDWNDAHATQVVDSCTAIGARARFWRCDISDETAVADTVGEAAAWLGGLDVVVHVAGIVGAMDAAVDEIDRADWDYVLGVNLTGAFLVVKHATPHLERSRGAIILTGSGAGVFNQHRSAPYAASKGGLHGLVITLEEPLRARGIRINNLAPGSVDTPLALRNRHAEPVRPPEREPISAESVAAVMALLASDDAADIRGLVRMW